MKERTIFLISLIFIFSVLVISSGPPTIPPHVFEGLVTYSNNPNADLDGCEITADFNEEGQGVVGEIEVNNYYEALVETEGDGGEVVFYVGGVQATPTVESESFKGGWYTEIDLMIDDQPNCAESFCGNGQIDPGEACDGEEFFSGLSCSSYGFNSGYLDCSNSCTILIENCYNSGGGDGNSGGGGGGGGGGGSGGSSSSNKNTQQSQNSNNSVLNLLNNTEKETDNSVDETKSSGITGAVVGFAKSGLGIGLIFAVIIVILGIAIISSKKKKSKEVSSNIEVK